MSKLLYSQSTQQTYGYPRSDDQPVVGLDADFLVLTKIETAPPDHDPAIQSLSSTYEVDIDALEYRQVWSVTDNLPVPNWDGFNTALLTNPEFIAYQQAVGHPTASAVLDAYALVATGGVAAFNLVFNLFCHQGTVTPEHRTAWADIAAGLNLPTDFVEVIRG